MATVRTKKPENWLAAVDRAMPAEEEALSPETRATEASVRAFWKAYRMHMGL